MRNGHCDLALRVFEAIPLRNSVSYNAMISGNGRFRDARVLFDSMPENDAVSWNAMLSGYVWSGHVDEARDVFDRMPHKSQEFRPSPGMGYLQHMFRVGDSRRLVAYLSPNQTGNCLMGGYVKTNMLGDAKQLFDQMPVRDVISWNTMISGYEQDRDLSQARRWFEESPKREMSYNVMIPGYAQYKRMDMARELFEAMPFPNIGSWNIMISGYCQNGDVAQARNLFDMMPRRDSVSWAAIIAGYAQNGLYEEAMNRFVEMKRDGESLNRSTFCCALSACADISALELGKQVHGQVVKTGYEKGCLVGNVL
ncbi:Pentatricopeptide repeat-containing protein [Glycine max]|nr:Pentatricopeptide repeat-containing protein [Glycine max]